MATVVLESLTKVYSEKKGAAFQAVNGINLEIKDQEFMVLVGPSGCGKSTTLRMIAGLEEISAGRIFIDGRIVNDIPPKDRDIAMVFQNYALYPHMSVYENMAFGLKLRKMPKPEIEQRVRDAAGILGLESLLERKPKALSGGQRQRVALGRAIVRKPKVFLFDEPLSNLDAKMRVSMRTEIARLHDRLDATMIYVTHDQVEAMTMGDRICVMKDGNIMQVAEPLQLYNQPDNHFAASFIGSPPMNFLRGILERSNGRIFFREANDKGTPLLIPLDGRLGRIAVAYMEKTVMLGVRPEDLQDTATAQPPVENPRIEAIVEVAEPMGAETLLYLTTGSHALIARVRPTDHYERGTVVQLTLNAGKLHLFDEKTGSAIT